MFQDMLFENKRIVQKIGSEAPLQEGIPAIIQLERVDRCYPGEGRNFYAVREISLSFQPGTLAAIIGASGSGKSTLLNLIAGLDQPTKGSVRVAGSELGALSEDGLSVFRGKEVGVVFQFFQLLPTLTALENILLAMDLVGIIPRVARKARALSLLDRVGVQDQADKLPRALSGGQQQRVAIARALANDPPLLVADEPTGNLDSRTKDQVFCLLRDLSKEGKTVLMATHEQDHLSEFDEIIRLKDGRLVEHERRVSSQTRPLREAL
jgi:putative ABC transport system ATP-binding protein